MPCENISGPYSGGARSPRRTYSTPRFVRSWLPSASTHASLPPPALNHSSIGWVRSKPAASSSCVRAVDVQDAVLAGAVRWPSTTGDTTESRPLPRAGEDLLGDRLAVDGQRQRLAHPRVGVPLLVQRQAEEGEAGRRRLDEPARELLLRGAGSRRPGCPGRCRGCRPARRCRPCGVGVDAELDRLDRRRRGPLVLVEGLTRDALARARTRRRPGTGRCRRLAAERLRVVEERLGEGKNGL